jgi:hypothetical protein
MFRFQGVADRWVHRNPQRRRGAVAALVMISLLVMLGCVTLAIDGGYIGDLCAAMQSTVDSSALAGASGLEIVPVQARQRAEEYAALNEVAGSGLTPSELTITIGHWYGLTNTFVPDDGAIPSTPNAVRVSGRRANIPLFFANALGISNTTVIRSAAAMQGAARCLGVWGLEGIVGPGDVITDSYIHDDGPYGGINIRPNGDICSCQDITIGGNTEIHGDAIYGDGYDLTLLGTSYEIWGRVDDQVCQLSPPTYSMPGAIADNDNANIPLSDNGNTAYRAGPKRLFLASDDNLTLPAGTEADPARYYFSSVQIEGQATVTIVGPTHIYISGNAMFGGGGIVNAAAIPENLRIYSTGSTMTFNGGSTFYGGIIATSTDLSFVGASDIYGMMIGQTIDFRGTTNIHVEENMVLDIFGLSSVAPMLIE